MRSLIGWPEFHYLVGQTFPYHDKQKVYYDITEIAFEKDSNGNKVLWSKNPKDVTALILLGQSCNFISVRRREDQSLKLAVTDVISPVTHKDSPDNDNTTD